MLFAGAVAGAVLLLAPAAGASSPAAAAARCAPAAKSAPVWIRARRMTVLADSVLLGGIDALKRTMPCWRMRHSGRSMINVVQTRQELPRRVAPVVVIGLGYNTYWDLDRRLYAHWAKKFDRDALQLLRALRRRGARQFVWITARVTNRRNTPQKYWYELRRWSYFPYINERLRPLDRRVDDMVLADWNRVSGRMLSPTYDGIHLNRFGARLMARTIRDAIFTAARRA